MNKISSVVVSCIAAVVVGGYGCGKEQQAAASLPRSAPEADSGLVVIPPDSPMLGQIRVEPVRAADLPTEEVVVPGKIEVNPQRVSHVVMPVAGRVVKVLVQLGDAVSEGQPLLVIQSPDTDAALASQLQAEAAVTQAKAALMKAQADFDRLNELYEHRAAAKKDVLDANNTLAQAKAAMEQVHATREQAVRRIALLGLKPGAFQQQVIVRAPLAGKVLEINVAPGEYRNDTNASLMTVADLRTVWVVSNVPESYIRFIDIGERVEISLIAYPGETFEGRVLRIADTVDPQTRTVKVRAEMDNTHGRLRPEMFGSVHHIESTEPTPVVPAGAVIQGDGQSAVFVEHSPGHFQRREVTVGKRTGDIVPLLSGVKAGDRVVVDGPMLLKGLARSTS
jgi:membrane fusion protein, heavy metal efflux system